MSNLFFTTDSLKSFANKIKEYILGIASTKADISHSHSNYAENGHTHNTNYTKTETDILLANKANVSYKNYSAFGTASTEADGWYTLFTISDNLNGSALCALKAYAHSSVVFTATKGYSTTATLNILDCNTSSNGSYAYIKALRILSDGKVQVRLHTGMVNISINIFSANGNIAPVDSLICDTSSPTVCAEKVLTSGRITANGFVGDLSGNAETATKLQTSRTIGLGAGAIGTATSFNGAGNITIPVTDIKEAYLSWGGRNLSGTISPIDAACSNVHNANRFAFAQADGITIEYSTNGSTYSTYNTTDFAKINLVSGISANYYIGARSSSTTVNDKLRITLNATNMGVYARLQKLLINISTGYATGSNVIVEKSMNGSESTFTTVGTYSLDGWSGWNSIPLGYMFGGGSNQTSHIAALRLTFGITGVDSSQTYNALAISDIIGIGDACWSNPSNMAKNGHIYTYDASQNATFPADITATTFLGNLSGNASSASAVAWSGVTSKPSYYDAKAIKSITRNGTTFTYTCMDGTTGTFTQQDNNTTYSAATTGAAGLMSAADKTKLDGIATGANKITVDSAMSTTSTNPVQNKVVKAAIDNVALTVTSDGVLVLSK